MPRFWQVTAILLGLLLLILSAFLLLIRQQEPQLRMLVQSNRDGGYDFYVTDIAGIVHHRIPSQFQRGMRTLTVEGGWVLYGNGLSLASVRLNGENQRILLEAPEIVHNPSLMSISPDKQWLVFAGGGRYR